ncbi:MAG: NAD-dependent epimerase/dehydratase family protein [Gemmatimonadota bacterium]
MRVFLTGGTGLLGSHLADRLTRGGHEVVALHRRESDTRFLQELGCRLVEGDVRDDAGDLAQGMEGCTHLVHGAALVYSGGSWPRIRSINVDGTRNVFRAADESGVPAGVHISSVAVYGTVEGPVDETAPTDTPLPPGDLYARSKREAEKAARVVVADAGIALATLRPVAVYGERDRLMALRLAKMVMAPVTFLLGRGDNTLPAVYAGNVAGAVVAALDALSRGTGVGTWNVGVDHPVTQRQLLEGLARGMGRRPRFIPVPAPLVLGAADVLERLGVSAPGAEHLPMGRVARLAVRSNPYTSDAIRRDLQWAPDVSLEEGLERTGRWLRDVV